MKLAIFISTLVGCAGGAAWAADEMCYALVDTALYADVGLSQEVRPVFQFDGAQFAPQAKDGETMFGNAYDVRMEPMLEGGSYVRASDWKCEAVSAAAGADEVFDVSAGACQQELSDTRVTFSGSSIGFYETTCDITAETATEDGATRASMTCYGEGSEWPAEAVITDLQDGGRRLEVDGNAQVYVRCP